MFMCVEKPYLAYLNNAGYTAPHTLSHCCSCTVSRSVQVVGMPKAFSQRNIQPLSTEHLLLTAILQDNYSMQLCLGGRSSKDTGAVDLEHSAQRKVDKIVPLSPFSVFFCVCWCLYLCLCVKQ